MAIGKATSPFFKGRQRIVLGPTTTPLPTTTHVPVLYNDWFLPSNDELIAMYTELHLHGLGSFIDDDFISYWGSSEHIYTMAWSVGMDTGISEETYKDPLLHVRACRSFIGDVGDYIIRDIGPTGGLIFAYSGGKYYEAAPADCSDSAWSNIIDSEVTGTGTAIGTGQANTTAIIDQEGHTNSAAKLCNDLEIYF